MSEKWAFINVDDLITLKILAEERANNWREWWRQSKEDGRDDDAESAYENIAVYDELVKSVQQAIDDAEPIE